jgi:hypothetical protein
MSNSTLEGSTPEVANSLASFRLVSAIRRGFPLLFLCCCVVDRSLDLSVVPVKLVARLGLCVGGRRFRDQVNQSTEKGGGSDERIKHESRGKDQALSFCQRLIQLWLRSQLKHKYFRS